MDAVVGVGGGWWVGGEWCTHIMHGRNLKIITAMSPFEGLDSLNSAVIAIAGSSRRIVRVAGRECARGCCVLGVGCWWWVVDWTR